MLAPQASLCPPRNSDLAACRDIPGARSGLTGRTAGQATARAALEGPRSTTKSPEFPPRLGRWRLAPDVSLPMESGGLFTQISQSGQRSDDRYPERNRAAPWGDGIGGFRHTASHKRPRDLPGPRARPVTIAPLNGSRRAGRASAPPTRPCARNRASTRGRDNSVRPAWCSAPSPSTAQCTASEFLPRAARVARRAGSTRNPGRLLRPRARGGTGCCPAGRG